MVAGMPPNRWVCLACPKWSHIQLRFHFSAQPFKKPMNEILKHTQAFFFLPGLDSARHPKAGKRLPRRNSNKWDEMFFWWGPSLFYLPPERQQFRK